MEKISIVIPIHNGINDTLKCLESLSKVKCKDLSIIIIDDGSTDRSKEIIKEQYKETIVLQGDGNLWWSGSINKGIKYAIENNSEFIILLNNDNIVKKNFTHELLKTYNKYRNCIVASKVYSLDDKLIHSGGYFDLKQGLKLYNNETNNDNDIEIEWCGGMGVLIHKNVFEKIGFFDEKNFPQYYGDADFMYRARAEGMKIFLSSKSLVWNNEESTGLKANVNNLNELKQILTSVKSNNNIKINWMFYKSHFGIAKASIVIITRYAYIIGGFIKRKLKRG